MYLPRAFVEADLERMTRKFKLSQNHPETNRIRVSDQLAMSARAAGRDTAKLMRKRFDAPTAGDRP